MSTETVLITKKESGKRTYHQPAESSDNRSACGHLRVATEQINPPRGESYTRSVGDAIAETDRETAESMGFRECKVCFTDNGRTMRELKASICDLLDIGELSDGSMVSKADLERIEAGVRTQTGADADQ